MAVAANTESVVQRRSSPLGWLMALAALAIFAVGALTLYRANTDRPLAPDPPGPLFVLPTRDASYTLETGGISDLGPGQDEQTVEHVATVGRETDAGYTDLIVIRVGVGPLTASLGEQVLGLASGPATLIQNTRFQFLVQSRGSSWITLVAPAGIPKPDLTSVLDAVTLNGEGRADLSGGTGHQVLERHVAVSGQGFRWVSAHTTPDDINVNTFSWASPLEGASYESSDVLRKVRVQGRTGWQLSREGWTSITWRATPNRVVAVSGEHPVSALADVAAHLTIVSEEEWKAAVPDFVES